jgi:hypothetical protein
MQYLTLNDGNRMPQLGLGVFQIDDLAECEPSVVPLPPAASLGTTCSSPPNSGSRMPATMRRCVPSTGPCTGWAWTTLTCT